MIFWVTTPCRPTYVCPNVSEELVASTFKVADIDLGGCINNLKENVCLLYGKVSRIVARPIILKMEAARSSETSKESHYFTRYNNPEVNFLETPAAETRKPVMWRPLFFTLSNIVVELLNFEYNFILSSNTAFTKVLWLRLILGSMFCQDVWTFIHFFCFFDKQDHIGNYFTLKFVFYGNITGRICCTLSPSVCSGCRRSLCYNPA